MKIERKPALNQGNQAGATSEPAAISYFNHLIEKGIYFLLIFTPLAFGGVKPWAFTIMEAVSFIIFGAWLLRMAALKRLEFYITPLLFFMLALAAVAVIQIIPMPPVMLSVVSSSSLRLYNTFLNDGAALWRPISIDPQSTLDELWKLLSYIAVFIVIINHFKTRPQITKTLRLVIWLGVGIAVFAVIQRLTWNGRMYWFYPVKPGFEPSTGHIWGPYINRNHFAGYMEMAIPLALGFFLYRMTEIKVMQDMPIIRKLHIYAANNALMHMCVFMSSALVMTAVLFISLSRGGIAGLAVGIIVFLLMSFKRKSLKGKAAVLAMIGAVLLVLVVILSWGRMEDRFDDLAQADTNPRFETLKDSVNLVRDFPLLGTGFGTFKTSYLSYQTKHSRVLFIHADDDYLETMADMGLIGLALAVGIIFFFFYPVVQVWRVRNNTFVKCMAAAGVASCSALVLHGFTDFNTHIPANAMLLTVIAASTYALVFNVSDRGRKNVVKKL